MKKDKHPDRDEMLKTIASGRNRFRSHLAECAECRELYELMSQFGAAVEPDVEMPPETAVSRWAAIARIENSRRPAQSMPGLLAFDSWTQRPSLQIRDGSHALERRVRFQAGKYTIEMVGDRRSEGWDFSARVYVGRKVTSEFVLKVGQQRLVAGAQDCYFWSSRRPPRRIRLLSPDLEIDCGEITW